MDVHPPHKPIHSIKEFMVHLLAITIGLLIALGLESSVEWAHHRHQAQEARQDIEQEIRDNQKQVVWYLGELDREVKVLKQVQGVVDDELHGRPAKPLPDGNFHDVLLQESAWNAASSSGVITHMSHDEVKRYETSYTVQKAILSIIMSHVDDRLTFWLFYNRMHSGEKLSRPELESGKRTLERIILLEESYENSSLYLNDVYTKALTETK